MFSIQIILGEQIVELNKYAKKTEQISLQLPHRGNPRRDRRQMESRNPIPPF